MKQNHGWGRRQLLQRARRELRGGDDRRGHEGRGHGRPSRTLPLSFTTLTRSGYAVNQGVRILMHFSKSGGAFLNALQQTRECASGRTSAVASDLLPVHRPGAALSITPILEQTNYIPAVCCRTTRACATQPRYGACRMRRWAA